MRTDFLTAAVLTAILIAVSAGCSQDRRENSFKRIKTIRGGTQDVLLYGKPNPSDCYQFQFKTAETAELANKEIAADIVGTISSDMLKDHNECLVGLAIGDKDGLPVRGTCGFLFKYSSGTWNWDQSGVQCERKAP